MLSFKALTFSTGRRVGASERETHEGEGLLQVEVREAAARKRPGSYLSSLKGESAKHRGNVRSSNPAVRGSNLPTAEKMIYPKNLFIQPAILELVWCQCAWKNIGKNISKA